MEVVRGQKACERIKAQGVSSEIAKSGFEYMLVCLNVGFFRKGRGLGTSDTYNIRDGQVVAVSADGRRQFEIHPVLRQPQPQLIDVTFNPGESHSGWILLQVPKDEAKAQLIFNRENVEKGKPFRSVVVMGTGGVGLNAVQGATFVGAHWIIAVDVLDSKLAVARTFGATHSRWILMPWGRKG